MASCLCVPLVLSLLLAAVRGLKLTELVVPSHADIGETISLKCNYDLGGARLYSVKWYKDEFEFFRFMPEHSPQMQIFPLNGIALDESNSDKNTVTLTQLAFNSSGTYRCEVSTEAPNFETVVSNRNLTVLAYPKTNPAIFGVLSSYSVGDYVIVNCTADRSNPAPQLSWFINGVKADKWLLDEFPMVVSTESQEAGPLYSRALGLRFQAEKRHFQVSNAAIDLRCSAAVADLPPWESLVSLRLSGPYNNQLLKRDRLRNHGSRTSRQQLPLIISQISIVLFCLRS